jgi:hypothetical protein
MTALIGVRNSWAHVGQETALERGRFARRDEGFFELLIPFSSAPAHSAPNPSRRSFGRRCLEEPPLCDPNTREAFGIRRTDFLCRSIRRFQLRWCAEPWRPLQLEGPRRCWEERREAGARRRFAGKADSFPCPLPCNPKHFLPHPIVEISQGTPGREPSARTPSRARALHSSPGR